MIATETVVLTPAAVVQAPPRVVTVAFVMNGNVRTVPLTVVRVTVGAAVLTMMFCAPVVPVLVAASVWVTVTRVGAARRRAPGRWCTTTRPRCRPGCRSGSPAPVIATETVAASPDAVPHAPPSVVTACSSCTGTTRAVPFTVVSVTTGAVVSTVIVFAPLSPVFPAVSAWVAVTE